MPEDRDQVGRNSSEIVRQCRVGNIFVEEPLAKIAGMTDEYLGKMLGVACEMANAQGATLFIVDKADPSLLHPFLVYNLPVEYIRGIGTVRVGSQCCGRAVEHKKPWIVSNMLTDPLFAEGREGALNSPIRAGFSVPVLDGEHVVAALACHFDGPHTPSDLDIERNQVFANLFAIALRGRTLLNAAEPYYVQTADRKDPVAASA